MGKITLIPYSYGARCRAFVEPAGIAGEAWPVRRFKEAGQDLLEAVVTLPGSDAAETYRFEHDGTNWITTEQPITSVSSEDLSI